MHRFIVSHGAYPSPLGYREFPKSCCTSVNNVVAHGIPDGYVLVLAQRGPLLSCHIFSRKLEDGDIINIDITVFVDGHHGDTSRTFMVGDVVSSILVHIHQDTDVFPYSITRMTSGGDWLPLQRVH